MAVVPSGGRTGLAGGAVAARGELVVSLGRMSRIDPVAETRAYAFGGDFGRNKAGIAAAQSGFWRAILLVGDEPYYTRVGFARLPSGRVKFPGPVDQNRILGLSLKAGELLTLSGEVRRAQIDEPVCPVGAGVG